ncbi:hypothetical protein MUN82_01860 [Hymenobacter aerilatus]|uniref:Terminase small subunit protein n=1 Tax=Hymenobacter aerilatus TaxID=2932251 RepID=A0A8T9T183_9BACT|nr:hypothetical protein [Hymenobacter aerilatus]UOR05856.1 hypothetical protein MUN82_01860 [Hymenobacter aerilatus]
MGVFQYSDEIREKICEGIAEGKSLRKVCSQPGFPGASTVVDWLTKNHFPAFTEQYAHARKVAYQLMADELADIADDDSKDQQSKQNSQRSKLKVDTRKWVLSKMLPKVYGDKLTLAGDSENPIVTNAAEDTSKLTTEELEILLELRRKMRSE